MLLVSQIEDVGLFYVNITKYCLIAILYKTRFEIFANGVDFKWRQQLVLKETEFSAQTQAENNTQLAINENDCNENTDLSELYRENK